MKNMKLLIIGIFIFLSACGGEKQEEVSKDGQTTIRVASWSFLNAWWGQAVEEFERLNPDIKVETVEILSADYTVKSLAMLASQSDLDVLGVKSLNEYINYVQSGYLVDLSSLIDKDIKNKEAYQNIFTDLQLDFKDNKIYMSPFRSDIFVLFYNKSIFDQAGIPYPDENFTWEELRTVSKKIKDTTGVYGTYFHTWAAQVQQWGLIQNKGDFMSGDYQFMKPMYEYVLTLQDEDKSIMPYNFAESGNIHYEAEFIGGRSAMVLVGSWMFNVFARQGDKLDWGIAPLPYFADANEKPSLTKLQHTGHAIPSYSKKQEEAWRFIKFMTEKEGAMITSAAGVYPSYVDEDIRENFYKLPTFPKDPVAQKSLNPDGVVLEMRLHKDAPEILRVLDEVHTLIMSGNVTVDEGIAEMESRVKEILATSKK